MPKDMKIVSTLKEQKKIFCKDFVIDNSLTTKIEFEPCENLIILSRALEGEVKITRLKKREIR